MVALGENRETLTAVEGVAEHPVDDQAPIPSAIRKDISW